MHKETLLCLSWLNFSFFYHKKRIFIIIRWSNLIDEKNKWMIAVNFAYNILSFFFFFFYLQFTVLTRLIILFIYFILKLYCKRSHITKSGKILFSVIKCYLWLYIFLILLIVFTFLSFYYYYLNNKSYLTNQ